MPVFTYLSTGSVYDGYLEVQNLLREPDHHLPVLAQATGDNEQSGVWVMPHIS
jgi:hypothetical protein